MFFVNIFAKTKKKILTVSKRLYGAQEEFFLYKKVFIFLGLKYNSILIRYAVVYLTEYTVHCTQSLEIHTYSIL